MGAGRKLSLQEHVDVQTRRAANRGGRFAGKLKSWKSKEAQVASKGGKPYNRIYVALSTTADIVELPIHAFPKLVVSKSDNKEETRVFNTDYNCFEDIEIIENQFRYDKAGRREFPPVVCPMCRLADWYRQEIQDDESSISWLDKAFVFESDKGKQVIHAGGLCGMFGGWDMSEEDTEALKEAGINPKEGHRESLIPKIKFLYCVVDLGNLEGGLQVTVEPSSLGNGMVKVIEERCTELGERGDPARNPYPFRWKFVASEKPQSMYSCAAVPWDEVPKFTENLKKQALEIIATPKEKLPGAYFQLQRWPNVKHLRMVMEETCETDGVPWDAIFGPVEKLADKDGWVEDADDRKRAEEATSFNHGHGSGEKIEGHDDDGEDVVTCGACGKDVPIDATKCPHCGEAFDEEETDDGGGSLASHVETKAEPEPAKPPETPKVLEEAAKARSKKPSGKGKGKGKKTEPEGPPPGETVSETMDRVLDGDNLPWDDAPAAD